MTKSKLVRDKIPQIIKQSGQRAVTHVAHDQEYWLALRAKLREEVQEFLDNEDEMELVDIFQVLQAIMDQMNLSARDIERLRLNKEQERGGFEEKIILERVD